MKFYVIESGKGALYINNVIGEGNWEKLRKVYISGIKTTGLGGQWTRFLRDEDESIDLVASGEIQFETFSWPQKRSWTATIDGVATTVSMQNGDALLNLTDFLIPDPTQSYDFDEIRCDAVLKSEYESTFAVAIGHAET